MFSSQEYIDNKTGRDDLSRFQYLQALVTEFQDTSSDGTVYTFVLRLTSQFRTTDFPVAWLRSINMA
jgi:hypothetical protein